MRERIFVVRFARTLARGDIESAMEAAHNYEKATKERGRQNGALGYIALRVLRTLIEAGDREPPLSELCRELKYSRAPVWRGRANLRAHGFLDELERVRAQFWKNRAAWEAGADRRQRLLEFVRGDYESWMRRLNDRAKTNRAARLACNVRVKS